MSKCTVYSCSEEAVAVFKTPQVKYTDRFYRCKSHFSKEEANPSTMYRESTKEGWYPLKQPSNAAYITKNPPWRREYLGQWEAQKDEKARLKPLETAIYGVNKKAEPTHERTYLYRTSKEPMMVIAEKGCGLMQSAVSKAVSKLEADRKNKPTYYWDPEYVGDGSID